jgi:hypothetical protein
MERRLVVASALVVAVALFMLVSAPAEAARQQRAVQ